MENRYLVLTEHRVFSVWKWTALSFEDVGKEKKGECFFCSRVEEILSASEIRRLCSSGSGLQGGALKMSQIAGTVRIISLFAIPGHWLQNLEQAWFKQLGLGGDTESTGVSPVPCTYTLQSWLHPCRICIKCVNQDQSNWYQYICFSGTTDCHGHSNTVWQPFHPEWEWRWID